MFSRFLFCHWQIFVSVKLCAIHLLSVKSMKSLESACRQTGVICGNKTKHVVSINSTHVIFMPTETMEVLLKNLLCVSFRQNATSEPQYDSFRWHITRLRLELKLSKTIQKTRIVFGRAPVDAFITAVDSRPPLFGVWSCGGQEKRPWLSCLRCNIGGIMDVKAHQTLPLKNAWAPPKKKNLPLPPQNRAITGACYLPRTPR